MIEWLPAFAGSTVSLEWVPLSYTLPFCFLSSFSYRNENTKKEEGQVKFLIYCLEHASRLADERRECALLMSHTRCWYICFDTFAVDTSTAVDTRLPCYTPVVCMSNTWQSLSTSGTALCNTASGCCSTTTLASSGAYVCTMGVSGLLCLSQHSPHLVHVYQSCTSLSWLGPSQHICIFILTLYCTSVMLYKPGCTNLDVCRCWQDDVADWLWGLLPAQRTRSAHQPGGAAHAAGEVTGCREKENFEFS